MHFEEGVIAVGLAGQERLNLTFLNFGSKCGERIFRIAHDFLVMFLFAKLDQAGGVVQARVELRVGRQRRIQVLPLAKKLLSAQRIIPKARVFNDRVQARETGRGFVPVKDTSARAKGIA
jgi:hypothetical protein